MSACLKAVTASFAALADHRWCSATKDGALFVTATLRSVQCLLESCFRALALLRETGEAARHRGTQANLQAPGLQSSRQLGVVHGLQPPLISFHGCFLSFRLAPQHCQHFLQAAQTLLARGHPR